MLLELDESIFLKIYGPEWESGENLSNILIVTLADYFQVGILRVVSVCFLVDCLLLTSVFWKKRAVLEVAEVERNSLLCIFTL